MIELVRSVTPRSRLLVGKIVAEGDPLGIEPLVAGLHWALEEGAEVICLPLALDFSDCPADERAEVVARYRVELDALCAAASQRALLLAAAGNGSRRRRGTIEPVWLPAAAAGVLAVGAVEPGPQGWTVCDESNRGVDLVAPGRGLGRSRGTSPACALAAGIAALWVAQVRARDAAAGVSLAREALLGSCDRSCLAPGTDPEDVGAGLIQAPPIASPRI